MHGKGKQILFIGESYKIGHQYLFLLYIYMIHNVIQLCVLYINVGRLVKISLVLIGNYGNDICRKNGKQLSCVN